MTEFTLVTEVLKSTGIGGIIFLMSYLQQKSTAKSFDTILLNQETRFEQILGLQSKREEQNFNLLKELIGSNNLHNSLLIQIKDKIDSNQFCPYIKNLIKEG